MGNILLHLGMTLASDTRWTSPLIYAMSLVPCEGRYGEQMTANASFTERDNEGMRHVGGEGDMCGDSDGKQGVVEDNGDVCDLIICDMTQR